MQAIETILDLETERVDDIPLLSEHLNRMEIAKTIDETISVHGNWQGISLGTVIVVWLVYILSQGDHRLSRVEEWVSAHLHTLRECFGAAIKHEYWNDDHLERVLRYLSEPSSWMSLEQAMGRSIIQAYAISAEAVVRVDTTAASGYYSVSEDGLFQFGKSKDHRPDLPQVKVSLATLDPLGLAVATQVVPGHRADDPLYLPVIAQVRETFPETPHLYVGDSKLGSVGNRGAIVASGDQYLCPLSLKQCSAEQLQDYLQWANEHSVAMTPVEWDYADGRAEEIAQGFERTQQITARLPDGREVHWQERHLVVQSYAFQAAQKRGLEQRLSQAKADLDYLNVRRRGKRRWRSQAALKEQVTAILKRYRVNGLWQLTYREPTDTEDAQVHSQLNHSALEAQLAQCGWRVYATNSTPELLSFDKAVCVYRDEYIVERSFGRFKGSPLSLSPLYLQKDDHITGLIHLLSIGLRVLNVLEFQVRRALQQQNTDLAGLYAGNPKRRTRNPSAEKLLEAFQNITLSVVYLPEQTGTHLTPLSPVQQTILNLLDFPIAVYTGLHELSLKSP